MERASSFFFGMKIFLISTLFIENNSIATLKTDMHKITLHYGCNAALVNRMKLILGLPLVFKLIYLFM